MEPVSFIPKTITTSFGDGIRRELLLDTAKKHDKEMAMFMSFSYQNADNEIYHAVLKALPEIKGYKKIKKRTELAFDIVQNLKKVGLNIPKSERKIVYKEVDK